MVALDTSNSTSINFAVNLYKKESKFSLIPDWLKKRKEVTQGFKNYYSEIQRKIGHRGFVFLKNETLAESISCHPKTISNYNKIAQHYNLITIVETGRGQLFVLNYHPWMDISEDQALKLKPQLPEKIIHLISKKAPADGVIFPESTVQTTENKIDSPTLENSLEGSLIEKDKEASATATSIAVEKVEPKPEEKKQTLPIPTQPAKGKYSLTDYTEYAKTQPNIDNISGFANWLAQEGKQDKNVRKFLRSRGRTGAAPGGLENKASSNTSPENSQTSINAGAETRPENQNNQNNQNNNSPSQPANQTQLHQLGEAAFFCLGKEKQYSLLQLLAKKAQLSPDLPLESLKSLLLDKISSWLGSFALRGDLSEIEAIMESGDVAGINFGL